MTELTTRLKAALVTIAELGPRLAPDQQDDVADAILDLAGTSQLPPHIVKPLLEEAEAAVARGDTFSGNAVLDELRGKLDQLPR